MRAKQIAMDDTHWFALLWESTKTAIAPAGVTGRTILHIHLGLAIYLGIAALRKDGLRSPLAIVLVVFLELLNEWADISVREAEVPKWLWIDSFSDLVSTLLWPCTLFVLADLFEKRDRVKARQAPVDCAEATPPDDHQPEPTDTYR